jgi:hypothetical protein
MQPTVLLPTAGARPPAGGRDLLRVGGAILGLALAAGIVLLTRRPPSTAPAPAPPAASMAPQGAPAVAAAAPVAAPAPAAPAPEPQGKVAVVTGYPVDVWWNGKLMGKGAAPQLSLPVGRQVVTLVAAPYFLRSTVAVSVRPDGVAGVEAPRLGKINIKASPDNCQVFIDGAFVDYPPILDRAIAAGRHRVSFTWPDGGRYEETADVTRGAPTYVTGRKD